MTTDTTHPPIHVLVLDDDPQVFHLIRRMLNKSTYRVTGATSVPEAMRLLQSGDTCHILLTDLALPHRDGADMIRKAARIDPPPVPVVISGNITQEVDAQLRASGVFDIIRKPFDIQRVRSVVAKAAETRNPAPPGEEAHSFSPSV